MQREAVCVKCDEVVDPEAESATIHILTERDNDKPVFDGHSLNGIKREVRTIVLCGRCFKKVEHYIERVK